MFSIDTFRFGQIIYQVNESDGSRSITLHFSTHLRQDTRVQFCYEDLTASGKIYINVIMLILCTYRRSSNKVVSLVVGHQPY